MSDPFEETLRTVIPNIAKRLDEELYALTEEQLRARWFYKWNPAFSKAQNLYDFDQMLSLYGSACRRWETHHHGSEMVVERVRDKYLMPRIYEFLKDFNNG